MDSIAWYADIMSHTHEFKHRAIALRELDLALERFLSDDIDLNNEVSDFYGGAILTSPDSMFRIASFQMLDSLNRGFYIGYIQRKGEKPIKLSSIPSNSKISEYRKLSSRRWVGAVYENLILHQYNNRPHYLLIGYIFNSEKKWSHVVDVISFKDGQAEFGAPIFADTSDVEKKYRLYRSFMAGSGAAIRYLEQEDRIITDHLSKVIDPRTNSEQYVPDGTYIGYSRKGELWYYDEFAKTPENRQPNMEVKPKTENRDLFGRKIEK